ncbi:MAG: glycosyltransferase, partial [Gammaproteobacteria bacterium]|nr:glycosyltransferase [Gammaproteobacteria bacterium]
WSTYPLATTHLIAFALHKATGLPWVADFRDPMVEELDGEWFPGDLRLRRARLWIEKLVARHATATTFCTDSARRIFVSRHKERKPGQLAEVIANGFDPEPFKLAEGASSLSCAGAVQDRRLTLVHSGTLYPGPDRDPGAFLQALCNMRSRGELPANLRVVLRATGFDKTYQALIEGLHLESVVELAPAVSYQAALREMLDADGLLLFQGRTSNPAIPAKVYEYLRARRPILALADHAGETAALLRRAGIGMLLPIDDAARIEAGLGTFLRNLATGTEPVLEADRADQFSRIHRVAEFATLFTRVSGA